MNLVTDGPTGIALAVEPGESDAMRRTAGLEEMFIEIAGGER